MSVSDEWELAVDAMFDALKELKAYQESRTSRWPESDIKIHRRRLNKFVTG